MSHVPLINDASDAPPRLAVYLNLGTLDALPAWSDAPRASGPELMAAIREAGFEGVQGGDAATARDAGLHAAAGGRLNDPGDLPALRDRVKAHRDAGCLATTLHVGWGMENDPTLDRLVDGVIETALALDHPLYIETHRATITQDLWRCAELTRRRPGVRFNADFSHWYTGLEMPYGDFDAKLDFLQPVFDRCGFMHGRIGNSGCIQVDVAGPLDDALRLPHVAHFVEMWTRTFAGFLRHAGPGDVLPFAPELLKPEINYARVFPGPDGQPREEGDRWEQALLYAELARHAFDRARRRAP